MKKLFKDGYYLMFMQSSTVQRNLDDDLKDLHLASFPRRLNMASHKQIIGAFLLVSMISSLLVVIAIVREHQMREVPRHTESRHANKGTSHAKSLYLLPDTAHTSQKLMPAINLDDYDVMQTENQSSVNILPVNHSSTYHASALSSSNDKQQENDSRPFTPRVNGSSTSHGNAHPASNNKHNDPGVRPDSCRDCFRHNFDYLIQNTDICDSKGQIDLLMLIFTSHANRRNRDVIRSTWSSISRNNTGSVRYVFLLGIVEDYSLIKSVQEESQQMEDLLMEDFFDSYANLTYKTIMGYKWANTYCPHARFVLKTDDDMWINVPNMLNVVNHNAVMLQNTVIGACYLNAAVVRETKSKWYASPKSYPHSRYTGYCSGTGYVTSMKVVTQVYRVSKDVPFFHLEDVYIAFCIFKLGFKLKYHSGFYIYLKRGTACMYKSDKVLIVHGLSLTYIEKMWATKCHVR
ncbi:beta-1,3-galactosyltransferase 1-like [Haliotis rufescens]|uniref:beta-1,3-galactosyltransferase 1-like n=1 Tax=Haliotis rufescens TaxID=6454 RepID=UPI001EAFF431|nr:beta-1,3-galactosyltransferase 1-like [Haliotis rufescens]